MANVVITGDSLSGNFIRPVAAGTGTTRAFRTELPTGSGASWAFTQWLLQNANGASVEVENSGSILSNLLVPLIPWILIFVFIWFFILRNLRKQQAALQAPKPVYIVNPESRP